MNWLGERVVADIRTRCVQASDRLEPGLLRDAHSGEVMSRLTADTTQVKAAASTAISQAAAQQSAVDRRHGHDGRDEPTDCRSLVLIAIPVIVLPLVAYGRSVRALSRQAQDTLAQASAYASESLTQVRVMQAFTHEDAASGAVRPTPSSASFERGAMRAPRRAPASPRIAIFLIFASVVGMLWFGAQDVLSGAMTGGRLVQFVLYAVLAAAAVGEL